MSSYRTTSALLQMLKTPWNLCCCINHAHRARASHFSNRPGVCPTQYPSTFISYTSLATRLQTLQRLTIPYIGDLKYPLSYRLSLWCCLRYPRPRVLLWLPLLHLRHFLRLGTHLEHIGKGQTRGLLPGSLERAVGRRCTKRRHEFCADLDTILWTGKGLMEFREALREEEREMGRYIMGDYRRLCWVGRYGQRE